MNFLVTNDDGIFAPGVRALVEVISNFGQVYVCCPDQERSAISHSITLRKPLNIQKTDLFGEHIQAWCIDGTPADCVKLALDVLIKEPIDYIISGINLGSNIGRDVYYSGTISAAVEGASLGYKAFAISVDAYDTEKLNLKNQKQYLYQFLQHFLHQDLKNGTVYNINLPYVEPEHYLGPVVTELDLSVKRYKHVHIEDGMGQLFYWLKDHRKTIESEAGNADFSLITQGYLTITPLTVSFINQDTLQQTQLLIEGALKK